MPLQNIWENLVSICYVVLLVFPRPLHELLAIFEVLTGCAGTTTRQTNGNSPLISSLRSSKANKITTSWTPVSSFPWRFVFHGSACVVGGIDYGPEGSQIILHD